MASVPTVRVALSVIAAISRSKIDLADAPSGGVVSMCTVCHLFGFPSMNRVLIISGDYYFFVRVSLARPRGLRGDAETYREVCPFG